MATSSDAQGAGELAAQVSITQTLSKEAPQAVANFAQARMDHAAEQYKAAAKEADPQVKAQMKDDALDKMAAWDEGGCYRVAMHVAMAAAGPGWQGALGAGASASPSLALVAANTNKINNLERYFGVYGATFV